MGNHQCEMGRSTYHQSQMKVRGNQYEPCKVEKNPKPEFGIISAKGGEDITNPK